MNNKKSVTIFGNEIPLPKEDVKLYSKGNTTPFARKKVKQKKDDTKKQD